MPFPGTLAGDADSHKACSEAHNAQLRMVGTPPTLSLPGIQIGGYVRA
jgi:hypothetical protein